MSEPNQREIIEQTAWRIANQFLLADKSGQELSRMQMEIRAVIQSAMEHEREACAKIADYAADAANALGVYHLAKGRDPHGIEIMEAAANQTAIEIAKLIRARAGQP